MERLGDIVVTKDYKISADYFQYDEDLDEILSEKSNRSYSLKYEVYDGYGVEMDSDDEDPEEEEEYYEEEEGEEEYFQDDDGQEELLVEHLKRYQERFSQGLENPKALLKSLKEGLILIDDVHEVVSEDEIVDESLEMDDEVTLEMNQGRYRRQEGTSKLVEIGLGEKELREKYGPRKVGRVRKEGTGGIDQGSGRPGSKNFNIYDQSIVGEGDGEIGEDKEKELKVDKILKAALKTMSKNAVFCFF